MMNLTVMQPPGSDLFVMMAMIIMIMTGVMIVAMTMMSCVDSAAPQIPLL